MNVTISIIIPIYNSEEYMEVCVDKILQQTFRGFELLLIDDGSQDNSLQVCNELAKRDSRIKVIHQENTGVSGARNTGIEEATGKYIAFVDSDDLVAPDYLEYLLQGMIDENTSLSMCGMARIYQHDYAFPVSHEGFSLLPAQQCAKKLLLGQFPVSTCGALFKRSMLQDLRFPLGIRNNEDKLFLYEYLLNNENGIVAFSNEKLYGYMVRKGSATSGSWRNIRDVVSVADIIQEETDKAHPEWRNLAENAAIVSRLEVMKAIIRSEKSDDSKNEYDSLKREVIKIGFPHNGSSRLKVEFLAVRFGKPIYRLLVSTYYKIYSTEKRFQHNEKVTRQG